MRAEDFCGLYAIIPAPARAGADECSATDTVDTEETSRLIENLIGDGARGIIALGTTGECATVSGPDFETLVTCVVDTVAGRVPTFIGATALGTHEVVRRLRFVQSRGATGTLLGLPMWQPLTTPMAIRYYRDIAGAFPGLDVMAYANPRAFRYDFPLEFWAAVADVAPNVVSAKASSSAGLEQLLEATHGTIAFLGNELMVEEFYAVSPDAAQACWATSASMGPAPALAILQAVANRDIASISRLGADIAWAHEPLLGVLADPAAFASYNIQLEKIRIKAAGYCVPGPIRPPYAEVPADVDEASRECGRRWRELCARIAAQPTGAVRTA